MWTYCDIGHRPRLLSVSGSKDEWTFPFEPTLGALGSSRSTYYGVANQTPFGRSTTLLDRLLLGRPRVRYEFSAGHVAHRMKSESERSGTPFAE